MKQKVKMLKTIKGAEDGVTVKDYLVGEIYEVESSFAQDIVKAKFAVKHGGGQEDVNFTKKGRVKKFAPKK